jgi:ribosomal protein L29
MKGKEIREMNINELKKLLDEKRQKAVQLRFDITSKQAKNHRDYRKTKKDISKILTILKEYE